jgi:inhibitor of cysteine peptidase
VNKKLVIASLAIMLIFVIALTKQLSTNSPVPTGKDSWQLPSKEELPVVGTLENFQSIIKEINKKQEYFTHRAMDEMESSAEFGFLNKDTASSEATSDYSSTNVQVAGVDEADQVKNDGTFIYQLRENQLVISKVNPGSDMTVVYTERFKDDFYPYEMYVDEQFLVLIGMHSTYDEKGYYYKDFTQVKVYQLNDRSNLSLVRESEIEGYYSSSRKINDQLYIVSNKHLPYYLFDEPKPQINDHDLKPTYRDSALSEELQIVDWDRMYYFPESSEANYLIVSGIDLGDLKKPMSVNSFLGAGNTIYATKEHLYITRTHHHFDQTAGGKIADLIFHPSTKQETLIYKFKLDNGAATFLTEGKVEGALLNQFSMDEYNGHLRIATTNGDMWNESNPSENLLFILNDKLVEVGSIRGIAKGERIYSARFMGDRGYIVTFKQVDPLFVLDLKDPTKPAILGELKIPGFSDYLHPYDENHIIGFGKDTIENDFGGAMVRGFKMALFDITDVNNPKEKFVEIIGDSGTHSELLYNHKALLFSKEKNIIGFPIDMYENKAEGRMMYPELSFQGAYVFGLDLEDGFQLKSRISHYDRGKATDKDWDYQKHISRLMYINETLYTISNFKIEAHDLNSFEKIGQLTFTK